MKPAEPLLGRVVFSAAQIHSRVQELGAQISHDHAGQELVLIGILKGTLFFLADLPASPYPGI